MLMAKRINNTCISEHLTGQIRIVKAKGYISLSPAGKDMADQSFHLPKKQLSGSLVLLIGNPGINLIFFVFNCSQCITDPKEKKLKFCKSHKNLLL